MNSNTCKCGASDHKLRTNKKCPNFVPRKIKSVVDLSQKISQELRRISIILEGPRTKRIGWFEETEDIIDELKLFNKSGIITTCSQPRIDSPIEKKVPNISGICGEVEKNILRENAKRHGFWYCFWNEKGVLERSPYNSGVRGYFRKYNRPRGKIVFSKDLVQTDDKFCINIAKDSNKHFGFVDEHDALTYFFIIERWVPEDDSLITIPETNIFFRLLLES